MDKALDLLENLNINKNDYIIVACSGGPDSMFLLRFLKDLGYKVVCAHVNHKVRSESDYEYDFVSDYCANNDIIFEGIILEGYESGNFENYAREFRYNFFEKLIIKYNSEYLFTAHHGDDLIETILMRIVRGSSLKGYAGFSKITKKKNYKVVRPLIFLTKDEILKITKDKDIPFVIDDSNNTDTYTRNRYRHHVLPFLKDEEPKLHERFILFSDELKDTVEYLDSVVKDKLSKMYKNNILDLNKFNKEDKYIKKRIILYILHLWYPDNLYLVNNNHVLEILKLISSTKPNHSFMLPNNLIVVREYDKLIFKENTSLEEYDLVLEDELKIPDGVLKIVKDSTDTSNYVTRLNKKDITLPLHVRTRKNGDKIKVKNMNGYKKISDIFIDNKISSSKRDTWPILVDDNNTVLWIPGIKKSDFDIAKNEEYDIIIKYLKKEED